jgi:hypothetical protein
MGAIWGGIPWGSGIHFHGHFFPQFFFLGCFVFHLQNFFLGASGSFSFLTANLLDFFLFGRNESFLLFFDFVQQQTARQIAVQGL